MATSTATGGLSRVTIVAPRTRMDLALPSDVPAGRPAADPAAVRRRGHGRRGRRHGGWTLSRLGGQPLDGGRTAAQLSVRDGEVLYFTPARRRQPRRSSSTTWSTPSPPRPTSGPGGWQIGTTRSFAAALRRRRRCSAGALARCSSPAPPHLPGALAALVVAVAAAGGAAVLSRAAGDSRTGAMLALVGLGYAAVGGLLLLAGDRTLTELASPHVLLARRPRRWSSARSPRWRSATGTPFFLGATGGGRRRSAWAPCSAWSSALGAAAAAAVVATVAFAALPALPMIAYRLARLPVPSIPTGPDDLKTDTRDRRRPAGAAQQRAGRPVPHRPAVDRVAAGARRAQVVLAAQRAAAGGAALPRAGPAVAAAGPAVHSAGPSAPRCCFAGTAGLGLAAAATFGAGSLPVRLGLILGGLLLAAVISLIYGLTVAGKRISPVWGRTARHRRDPADRRAWCRWPSGSAASTAGSSTFDRDRAHRACRPARWRRRRDRAGRPAGGPARRQRFATSRTTFTSASAWSSIAATRSSGGHPAPAGQHHRGHRVRRGGGRGHRVHQRAERAVRPGRRTRQRWVQPPPRRPVQLSVGDSGARSSPAAGDDRRAQLVPAEGPVGRARRRSAPCRAGRSRPPPYGARRACPPPRLTASTRASDTDSRSATQTVRCAAGGAPGRRVPDQGVRDDLGPGDRAGEVGEHRAAPGPPRPPRRSRPARRCRPVSATAANQPRSSWPMPSRVPRSVSSTTVSSGASAASRGSPGRAPRGRARSRRRRSRRRSIRSSYHQRPPRRAKAAHDGQRGDHGDDGQQPVRAGGGEPDGERGALQHHELADDHRPDPAAARAGRPG